MDTDVNAPGPSSQVVPAEDPTSSHAVSMDVTDGQTSIFNNFRIEKSGMISSSCFTDVFLGITIQVIYSPSERSILA